jgi:hypothetical protein
MDSINTPFHGGRKRGPKRGRGRKKTGGEGCPCSTGGGKTPKDKKTKHRKYKHRKSGGGIFTGAYNRSSKFFSGIGDWFRRLTAKKKT